MIGDIVFYSDNGWFGKLIKFFTRSKYTHVAVVIGEILDEEVVFESYLTQQYGRIGNPVARFRITNAAPEAIEKVLCDLREKHHSRWYAFFQLLWFVWRWFLELLGFKRVYQKENWFPNSNICSEMGGRFIRGVEHECDIWEIDAKWIMKGYNINSIHPYDLYEFCVDNSQIAEISAEISEGINDN